MAFSLPEATIRRRLQQWDNWRRHLPRLRARARRLEHENLRLRREMRAMVKEYEARVEALEMRVEQLTRMVFGSSTQEREAARAQRREHATERTRCERPPASYRRAIPCQKEITRTRDFPLDHCPACGGELAAERTVVRYIEDIPLPLDGQVLKTVEEQRIRCGYCARCRKTVAAHPYSTQCCTLGENVKMYVAYAVTVLGQTWRNVQCMLKDVYGIAVSDGEIAAILADHHRRLLPHEHAIAQRIRAGPAAHYDETSWPVQTEGDGQFAWVKTSSTTPDTLFRLARTRGKGNALELRGADRGQPAVTDDFAAYDRVFAAHGLCWAHAERTFRELASLEALLRPNRHRCRTFFARFHALANDVRGAAERPFDRAVRAARAEEFSSRIAVLCAPTSGDPTKLATCKRTFLQNREQYLLCVRRADVPLTNNKAERALRPLVIKRKLSFGSKTQKGAVAMQTLLSVLLTLRWSKPQNFFEAYRRLLQPA
jgi:transposase